MVLVYLAVYGASKLFSRVAVIGVHLKSYPGYVTVVLTCIFIMANDVQHLLIDLRCLYVCALQ